MNHLNIESFEDWEKRSSSLSIKYNLEGYRSEITQQIMLRLNQGEIGNLASSVLWYEHDNSYKCKDIKVKDNENYLWSSNQKIKNALNISNIRNKDGDIMFDKEICDNFLSSGIFKQDNKLDIYYKGQKLKKIKNCKLIDSFLGQFSSELLHSEQFITYMLTSKLEKLETNISGVFLIIVSRYAPCQSCYQTLTSEVIYKKIYKNLGVQFDTFFFYLNHSSHDDLYKKNITGNFGNTFYLVSPDVFIKPYSKLLKNPSTNLINFQGNNLFNFSTNKEIKDLSMNSSNKSESWSSSNIMSNTYKPDKEYYQSSKMDISQTSIKSIETKPQHYEFEKLSSSNVMLKNELPEQKFFSSEFQLQKNIKQKETKVDKSIISKKSSIDEKIQTNSDPFQFFGSNIMNDTINISSYSPYNPANVMINTSESFNNPYSMQNFKKPGANVLSNIVIKQNNPKKYIDKSNEAFRLVGEGSNIQDVSFRLQLDTSEMHKLEPKMKAIMMLRNDKNINIIKQNTNLTHEEIKSLKQYIRKY